MAGSSEFHRKEANGIRTKEDKVEMRRWQYLSPGSLRSEGKVTELSAEKKDD
jgi:hypothetical protein